MNVKYGMPYIRPEMYGQITVDQESWIDWGDIAETPFVIGGAALLFTFGDKEMISSFISAFVMTLVLTR